MNKLEEIHDKVQNAKEKKARLYFVTRKIKKGMTRSAKVADKYEYKAWSIDTDLEIQSELYKVFDIKLGNISDENKFTISDYTLIGDDDSKKILTYSKKEKLTSFMKIVDVDLINAATLDHVVNLTEIADDIWAYIIEVVSGKKTICALRKMAPSKVMVGKKGLMTKFLPKDKSLKISKEQNITFDKNIDVIYYDSVFYVVSKDNFEEIVGLQEEYRAEAKSVADKIMKSPMISVGYDISSGIEDKNRFIRKLAKVKDEIDKLDKNRIKRMEEVAKKFGQVFIIDKSGKIRIDNEDELDTMIKLLDDYFLESHQTGKKYGASVKKEM
jgi:hypothetical protein